MQRIPGHSRTFQDTKKNSRTFQDIPKQWSACFSLVAYQNQDAQITVLTSTFSSLKHVLNTKGLSTNY